MKRKFLIVNTLFIVFMLFMQNIFAQNQLISGKVTNQNGEPIAGASISVKGKNTTVISNNDGSFSINAVLNDELNITSIGYSALKLVISLCLKTGFATFLISSISGENLPLKIAFVFAPSIRY